MFRQVLFCTAVVFAEMTAAASLPASFYQTKVAEGLSSPVSFSIAPDGRVFICEQAGKIRVVKNGTMGAAPFLELATVTFGDRGMLCVAFDRDFATNNYVYVLHTSATEPYHNIVSRVTANGDSVVAGSRIELLHLSNFEWGSHNNSGCLATGPDGKLYIASGDAGLENNSQNLQNTHGKILRINTDGSIPADNPFYNSTTGTMRALWALGLRMPFTMNFDPQSGRLFINDVGGSFWEEIDEGQAGANYGWPAVEGASSSTLYKTPVISYGHGSGTGLGCAITGGTFYQPSTQLFPQAYRGSYFFMDYCGNWIRRISASDPGTAVDFATAIDGTPVGLQVSPAGELYYISRSTNSLMKISYTSSDPPLIVDQPADTRVYAGDAATFRVNASGGGTLTYQWMKNGTDIPNARSFELRIAAASLNDSGTTYSCRVSNSFGNATTRAAVLTVIENQAPVIVLTPQNGATFIAGQPVRFSATAVDPEEGELSAAKFAWLIHRSNNAGDPILIARINGVADGTFIPPAFGSFEPRSTYTISLSVPDSRSLTGTAATVIQPISKTLKIESAPSGLLITADGIQRRTPFDIDSVRGFNHSVQAALQQTVDTQRFDFQNWSGSTSANQNITVSEDATFTAHYVIAQTSVSVISSPGSLAVGSPVLFEAYATGKGPFSVEWNFGDGSVISGAASASHAYAAAGVYVVSVTITDSSGAIEIASANVTIGEAGLPGDSDGDGVIDAIELADGTNPNDSSSLLVRELKVTQLNAILDSKKAQNDRCSIKAYITESLDPASWDVRIRITNVQQRLSSGATGRGKFSSGKFAFKSFATRKKTESTFRVDFMKSSLNAIMPEVLNTPTATVLLPVSISAGGKLYAAQVRANCVVKSGRCQIKTAK